MYSGLFIWEILYYTWRGDLDILNIVMLGITNELPQYDEKHRLHRLLSSLLSDSMAVSEKLQILQNAFKIGTEDTDDMKMREEVRDMCNLSMGIYEKGISKGISIGEARVENMIVSLLKANQSVEFVAKVAKMTAAQVRDIGKKAAVL